MYDAQHLLDYLDERHIQYQIRQHPRTATAMRTAEVEDVSGKNFAKTVVIESVNKFFLAVLPAHLQVDLRKLEDLSRKRPLKLAGEGDFASLFPSCEVGAMPPFGRLRSLDVYVDDDIALAPEVTFNACSHEHTLTMSGRDFLRASEGVVGDFTE